MCVCVSECMRACIFVCERKKREDTEVLLLIPLTSNYMWTESEKDFEIDCVRI